MPSDYPPRFLVQSEFCLFRIAQLVPRRQRFAAEVTLGSRFLGAAHNVPWTRKLILKLGVFFTRLFSRVRVTDTHNGLRGFTASAAGKLHITIDRMAHANQIFDLIHHAGLNFKEVPVQIYYTDRSLAKGQRSMAAPGIALQYLADRFVR